MTGIDELRRTLDSRAHALHDDGIAGRADAARARARQTRQRRTVAVAVLVTAVLAAVTAVSLWPTAERRPAPADRILNGHVAPAKLQSLGYTYAFDEGV